MRLMPFFASALFLILFPRCTTTPETGRRQLNFIPESQMMALGAQAYQEILQKEPISRNTTYVREVKEVAERIAKASGADFDWEFNVIDDRKTANAFCLPGGKIAVYSGILPVAANNAGLAAVIGHEVAHATLHHGAERMSQNVLAQVGMQALNASFADNKYRGLIAAALGVGLNFGVMLPYSRKHEAEADYVGLIYMAKAGYDPSEAPRLWQRMAGNDSARIPEFLSTHPDPLKRAQAMEASLPRVQGYYGASSKQETQAVRL